MKKYYLMTNSTSMHNLGIYHQYTDKNYDEMKKYYLMAIEKGDSTSMRNLGIYYKSVDKNYDEMKKYYLMAIEKGCLDSMHDLGNYNQYTDKNYDEMKKYYLMAIEKGCSDSMYSLGHYYKENSKFELELLEDSKKNKLIVEKTNEIIKNQESRDGDLESFIYNENILQLKYDDLKTHFNAIPNSAEYNQIDKTKFSRKMKR